MAYEAFDRKGLRTVAAFVRFGASRFAEAGLCFAHGTDNAVDEALVLVLHALHLPVRPPLPAGLFHARRPRRERVEAEALLRRRIDERVPAPYLTGEAWFAGLRFEVDPRVLVPRSPLAELIEGGFQPWIDGSSVRRVLDLGTGSGCIAVACACAFPEATVDAVDSAAAALEVARRNAELHELDDRVRVLESDLFEGLAGAPDREEGGAAGGRYDLIVSNPPYVPDEEMAELAPEFRAEPVSALEGGADGLDVVSRILAEAPRRLVPDGALVVEIGASPIVRAALESRFDLPFVWLEPQRGGEGGFLLHAHDF
ncbi:MAG: 50S ribosomal protein L3 N(5)-glutamine methyltransferase [Immundisolibacterales bacterium]|nr:50S ribosomal protein L3 N(5)-glutamine methyltransferase [Immundisolibacterales bacterium]